MASVAHVDGNNVFILIEVVNKEKVLGLIEATVLLHNRFP
jgi:hypothetical protein